MPPVEVETGDETERLAAPAESMRALVFGHLPSCVRFSGYDGTEGDCSCGAA